MYDLFISYRRDGGHEMARLLYEHLKLKGLNCFFDLEELGSGQFNIKLLNCIEESENFVLILSPNALERCKNTDDWVRMEIEYAIEKNKNIVPVMMQGFSWPEDLPESLAKLPYYNGVHLIQEYFSASVARAIDLLALSKPSLEKKSLHPTYVDVNTDSIYLNAIRRKNEATEAYQYTEIAIVFETLGDYKDSRRHYKECKILAEKYEKHSNSTAYKHAKSLLSYAATIEDYYRAAEAFRKIRGYKRATDLELKCLSIIKEKELKQIKATRQKKKAEIRNNIKRCKANIAKLRSYLFIVPLCIWGTVIFSAISVLQLYFGFYFTPIATYIMLSLVIAFVIFWIIFAKKRNNMLQSYSMVLNTFNFLSTKNKLHQAISYETSQIISLMSSLTNL